MNAHLSFETLNDYADGLLPGGSEERARVAQHLAECDACRGELEALERVLAAATLAPREIEPPSDDWPPLRAELERRKTASLMAKGASRSWRTWRERSALAAAAVLLIVASSTVTTVVIRRNDSTPSDTAAQQVTVLAPAALPASFSATEAGYLSAAEELRAALDAQRGRLSPQTVAAVERSLDVIDQAIAEARAALLGDPGNSALIDILSSNYRRKLDLLRRASELGSQI